MATMDGFCRESTSFASMKAGSMDMIDHTTIFTGENLWVARLFGSGFMIGTLPVYLFATQTTASVQGSMKVGKYLQRAQMTKYRFGLN